METIDQVPKTALDVFRLLPEGTLCEVIDNVLYMSPAPTYTHQALVALLARRIGNYLENTKKAEIIISPFDVYLDDLSSVVQPDMLVLLNENRNILKDDEYIHGAPDIIIEVLSSDKKRDTVKKKNLYERAGVREYIFVDPETREISGWILDKHSYQLKYASVGVFKSAVIDFEFEF